MFVEHDEGQSRRDGRELSQRVDAVGSFDDDEARGAERSRDLLAHHLRVVDDHDCGRHAFSLE
jgi:hypothetical protein